MSSPRTRMPTSPRSCADASPGASRTTRDFGVSLIGSSYSTERNSSRGSRIPGFRPSRAVTSTNPSTSPVGRRSCRACTTRVRSSITCGRRVPCIWCGSTTISHASRLKASPAFRVGPGHSSETGQPSTAAPRDANQGSNRPLPDPRECPPARDVRADRSQARAPTTSLRLASLTSPGSRSSGHAVYSQSREVSSAGRTPVRVEAATRNGRLLQSPGLRVTLRPDGRTRRRRLRAAAAAERA